MFYTCSHTKFRLGEAAIQCSRWTFESQFK